MEINASFLNGFYVPIRELSISEWFSAVLLDLKSPCFGVLMMLSETFKCHFRYMGVSVLCLSFSQERFSHIHLWNAFNFTCGIFQKVYLIKDSRLVAFSILYYWFLPYFLRYRVFYVSGRKHLTFRSTTPNLSGISTHSNKEKDSSWAGLAKK